jgi:predicted nucleic acid-binding protein
MEPALLDSSVYISAFRGDITAAEVDSLTAGMKLWLSAVVLQELYAGATDQDGRLVEELERSFLEARTIVVPELTDWSKAGKIMAQVAAKYGYEKIGRGRLANDALIAASAARAGIRVLTANAHDFSRLAEFCGLSWQVVSL